MKKKVSVPVNGAKQSIWTKLRSKLRGNLVYAALILIAVCVCLTVNWVVQSKHNDIMTEDVSAQIDTVGRSYLTSMENAVENVLVAQMYALDENMYTADKLDEEIERYSLYRTFKYQAAFSSAFVRLQIYDANSDTVYDSIGTIIDSENYYDEAVIDLIEYNKDHTPNPLDRLGYYFRYWSIYGTHDKPTPFMTAVLSGKSDIHFALNADLSVLYGEYRQMVEKAYRSDVVMAFDGAVIASEIGQERAEAMLAALESDKLGTFWNDGGEKYRVVRSESKEFPMVFYTLVSEKEIASLTNASIREIVSVQLFSFILYLLIFACFGILFMRPIRKLLLGAIRKGTNDASHSSVKEMVAAVVQEREELVKLQASTAPIYTANLLTELLTERTVDAARVGQELDNHGIRYHDGAYYTCAIELGAPNADIPEEEMSLKKRLIVKRCNEIFQDGGFAVDLKDNLIGIACSAHQGHAHFESLIANINSLLIARLERHATIALGPAADSIFCLKASFDAAMDGLEYRISFDDNELIDCEKLDIKYKTLTRMVEKLQPALLGTIKSGDAEKAEGVVDELFRFISEHRYEISVREIVDVFIALLQAIYDAVDEARLSMIREQSAYELYKLAMASSKQELRKLVKKIVVTAACCFSAADRKEDNRQLRAVRKVCAYIDENYNRDLSLNELAEHVGLNPSYLSSMFKDIVGVSFSAYLENRRTEEAIRLMQDGSLRIAQVAEAVGYSSPNYFSRVFRKRMGMSPEQYRNLVESSKE